MRDDPLSDRPSEPDAGPDLDPRLTRLALVAVLGVAAALRLTGLDIQSLWRDEVTTLCVAQLATVGQLVERVAGDVYPPLSYLLWRGWLDLLGDSPSALRGLSALAGTLAIVALYDLGRRLVSRRVGLAAAALMALSTLHLYYAQEARAYALLTLLTLLSMSALTAWWQRPTAARAALYLLAGGALLYTHAFGSLVVLAQNLAIAWTLGAGWWRARRNGPTTDGRRGDWTRPRGWLLLQGGLGLLLAPWLPVMAGQARHVAGPEFWTPPPAPGALLRGLRLQLSLLRPPWATGSLDLADAGLAWLALLALLAAGAALVSRRDWTAGPAGAATGAATSNGPLAELRWPLLLAWMAAPPLLAWAVSQTSLHIFTHRNLIICAPATLLVAAALLARLPSRRLHLALLALLLAIPIGQLRWYYGEPHKEDWRGAQAAIAPALAAGDRLVLPGGDCARRMRAYYLDPALVATAGIDPTAIDTLTSDGGVALWSIDLAADAPLTELLAAGWQLVERRPFAAGVEATAYRQPLGDDPVSAASR